MRGSLFVALSPEVWNTANPWFRSAVRWQQLFAVKTDAGIGNVVDGANVDSGI